MPTIEHSVLGNAELHEIKGASAATAGQIPTADGAGGAPFAAPVVDASDGSAGEVAVANGAGDVAWSPRFYTITGKIADIGTPGQEYIAIPYSGNVVSVVGVLGAAITGADETITIKDNAGNAMGAITVANAASAAGDIDTVAPASNQDVTDNDWIEVETAGSSTGPAPWSFTLVIERDD